MSRHSNRSFSFTNDKHTRSSSSHMESDVATMQREIDAYTRKLELEKKRLYSISHMLNQQANENENIKANIKELKKIQENSKNRQATYQMGTLQKAISHYDKRKDNTLDSVQRAKEAVDNMRRQRASCLQQIKDIENEIQTQKQELQAKSDEVEDIASRSVMVQESMLELKQKNDIENELYTRELQSLQNRILEDKGKREKLNKTVNQQSRVEKTGDVQIDTFDTSGVLKRRLQKIIYKNKEKVKLIDQYIRNMTIIDSAFNQIKETTGITDIDEIQNTFIKSEEQNYSLLTYVDVLNQQSAHIADQNIEYADKITEQQRENVEKKRILLSTPDDEKFRKRIEGLLKQKEERVKTFQTTLDKLLPSLEKLLTALAGSKFNDFDKNKLFEYQNGLILNDITVPNYLGKDTIIGRQTMPERINQTFQKALLGLLREKQSNYLENEPNSDLEQFATEVLLYKAQKNELPNAISSTLQTHEIPIKDFKQKSLQVVVYNPQKDPLNTEGEMVNTLMNKHKLDQIAEDFLDKKKQPTSQPPSKASKR